MRLVNLTPHTIVLSTGRWGRHDHIEIESSGEARVSTTPGKLENISGIPVPVASPTVFGDVEGLPEPQDGVFYIVSAMVGAALKGSRPDVLQPGTGPNDGAIRNEKNHIVAVTRLVRS